MITDKELIKQIKQDPSKGISAAIDLFGAPIKAICISILNGYTKEDVEEAISDTFVALWRGIDHYNISYNASLKSYLYGMARRTALNKRRELMKNQTNEEYDEKLASDFNTEELAISELNIMMLRAFIDDMRSPEHEMFVKRYFEEKQVKVIAKELGVSEKYVENRIARGKQKLRKQFIENGVLL